jgi:hypothetical protein
MRTADLNRHESCLHFALQQITVSAVHLKHMFRAHWVSNKKGRQKAAFLVAAETV